MHPEARVAAALLRQGRLLDQFSSALLLLAAGAAVYLASTSQAPWLLGCCSLIVIFGAIEKYWALRVALDAELFTQLADLSLEQLDQGLLALHLLPAHKAGRPLDLRLQGALQLLKWQAGWLLLQLLLLIAGLLYSGWQTRLM